MVSIFWAIHQHLAIMTFVFNLYFHIAWWYIKSKVPLHMVLFLIRVNRQSWKTIAHASLTTQLARVGAVDGAKILIKDQSWKDDVSLSIFYMTESFSFPRRFIYLREIAFSGPYRCNFRKVRVFVYFIAPLLYSFFTSCIFHDTDSWLPSKISVVFRYEAVVFRRYVLALLSVGLLRKFEAYLVYLSLIWTKNLRRFSFFQKFRHFTYILLWFHLVIPSFPARIYDIRSRCSALLCQPRC